MQMCETCQAAPYRPRTQSSAGSPANLFRRRDGKKVRVMKGGCGPKSPAWWVKYDPATSSWKTCPASEVTEVPKSSLILPRWATTRNGVSFLLPPLEHPTSATDSSLWPTPTQADGMGGPGSSGRDGGPNLRTAVNGQLNPTWVEWLMGFPAGWTDLEDSETP